MAPDLKLWRVFTGYPERFAGKERKKEKDISSNTNSLIRSGDKQVFFTGTAELELVVILIS